MLYAGMFTVQPSTFVYRFAGDETFHVLDGDLDKGEQVSVHQGDIVSFPKGARSALTRDGTSTVVPDRHICGIHFLRTRKPCLLFGVGQDGAIVAQTIAQG